MPFSSPVRINLKEQLQFKPDDGLLRLGQERMLLFSQRAFKMLRGLMHDQLGQQISRMILTRFGYENGYGDYQALKPFFQQMTDEEKCATGPLLHSWCGIVKVEPEILEWDRSLGTFYFKGIWRNSYEAQIHLETFGLSSNPVCHSLTGYGSGWCSAFFGRPVLEIEKKCIACGDPHCEWEIRPIDQWDESAQPWKDALFSNSESIFKQLESSQLLLKQWNQNLEQKIQKNINDYRVLTRSICHDLSFPLSMLRKNHQKLSFASKLGGSSPILKDVTEEMGQMIVGMTQIVDHVLRLEQEMDQSKALVISQVSWPQVSAHFFFHLKDALAEKNLELYFEWSHDAQLVVDPSVFQNQILMNILTNAIKFSFVGGCIRVSAERQSEWIRVMIQDFGLGMDEEIVAGLFQKRIHHQGTCGESGSGLGLGIARHYLEMHNGFTSIESRCQKKFLHGSGTCVSLYFPFEKTH